MSIATSLMASILAGAMMSCMVHADDPWTLDDAVATTRELISARTGIPADQIDLERAEAVTFPDGSMGCPRQGMSYTQALVDGYRILMKANGRIYHYHGRRGSDPFYCAKPASSSGWIQDR